MCYFSDPEKRKNMKGSFKEEDLYKLADAFFHRALKLQIGCGAEPSIFPYNNTLIALGKAKRIPYISMTTNANLFSGKDWLELVEAGLDEVTISLHGLHKKSYEYFMEGASYEKFHEAMTALTSVKQKYPGFKIRINYTVNSDNLLELHDFFDVFGSYTFDILQIRPIQQIGKTNYNNFSWDRIYDCYDEIIKKIKINCKERGITCLVPSKYDIVKEENKDSGITESTYFYISPRYIWESDFDLNSDSYESYSKRTHRGKKLLKNVFHRKKSFDRDKKNLNYEVI
jgi:molybdenum cofactor biosynthesis enzyme MoaA